MISVSSLYGQISANTCIMHIIFFPTFSRLFYSNLYSLPRYLWLQLLIQTMPSGHRIRMVEYGIWRMRMGCATRRLVLPGCCGVFLQQPSRYQIEVVFPRGLKHHEKPISYISRPRQIQMKKCSRIRKIKWTPVMLRHVLQTYIWSHTHEVDESN